MATWNKRIGSLYIFVVYHHLQCLIYLLLTILVVALEVAEKACFSATSTASRTLSAYVAMV